MKVKLFGIWEIRHQRFLSENGAVLVYSISKDAIEKIKRIGRYHSDGGVLLRIMPIRLTPYDNPQIFEALKVKN